MVKTTDTKSSARPAAQQQQSQQPFFNKEGGNAFTSETTAAKKTPASFFVQRKLSIGQPNDSFEKEADAVADKVVQRLSQPAAEQTVQTKAAPAPAPTPLTVSTIPTAPAKPATPPESLQKKEEQESKEDEEVVQRKPIFDSMADPPDENLQRKESDATQETAHDGLQQRLQGTKGSGRPLPEETRSTMESSIGADFSNVRVHNNSEAVQMSNELSAQAFTHGSDIYFNSGKYDPAGREGQHLLAHELTHTVQQQAVAAKTVYATTGNSAMVQKDGETDTAVIKDAVNRYGNDCYNNLVMNVDNALSLFRNWYFSKDEGDEAFFNEIKTKITAGRGQSFGTTTAPSEADAFRETGTAISNQRIMFLTSFVNAISVFRDNIQRGYINTVAEIMERDYGADWGVLMGNYRIMADWHGQLHAHGVPPNNNAFQQSLLSGMIFAYDRWELSQRSAAYQGIYSMADPGLRQMQTGSEAEAQRLIARPQVNYGDILFPIGNYTLLDRQGIAPLHDEVRLIDISADIPLYGPVNVALHGALTAGYNVNAGFGPIMLRDINVGLNYLQTPAFFNLFGLLSMLDPLAGLKRLSAMLGLRLRGSTTLHVPASAMAELYLRGELGVGLDVGLANVLTLDLASVSGTLDATATAEFGAEFRAPIDFMVDHGNLSFSKAMSLDINSRLAFALRGGITARILTFSWSKNWDIASWEWAEGWNISSGMNLLYINGIQGDAKRVVNFQKIKKAISELQSMGNQIMHLNNTPGVTTTSAPSPRQELELDWPKPRASAYPKLYLTRPGETRSQSQLRSLFPTPGFVTDNGRQTRIEEFSPIKQKPLPSSSHIIGLDDEYQIGVSQTFVGPLKPSVNNPGGGKINGLVSPYGINPTVMNGDHVYELQVGGVDAVGNLWPLDAATNQGAGNFLKNAIVTDPSTGQRFRLSFLKDVVENNPGTNYFFRIVSYR